MRWPEALKAVTDRVGLALQIDWTAIKQAGINPEAKVSARWSNLTAARALTALVAQVAPEQEWDLRVKEGVVVVSVLPAGRRTDDEAVRLKK